MHSLVSIFGVVLSGKDNYLERSRKSEHTLIFNDLCNGICDDDTKPPEPTIDKELAIWMTKDKKMFALIVAFISEKGQGESSY